MVLLKDKKIVFWITGFFLIVGIQGCDQVSALMDYLSTKFGSEKPAAVSVKTGVAESTSSPSPKNSKKEELPANVLARVGEWTITIEEFKERLISLQEMLPDYDMKNIEQNKLILEELLRQQMLVRDAEKSGLAGSKDIVRAVEEFRRTLLVREVVSGITDGITVTDDDAKEYYTQNPQEFAASAEWQVREIAVDKEEEAKAILVELYQGADFTAIAAQKSKAKSAEAQGDLGYLSEFDFPKMKNIVSELDVGGISGIFNGPEGFTIVKLENKRGGGLKEFAELEEEIKTGLTFLKQQQAILERLNALRQKTTVYVNEELLK